MSQNIHQKIFKKITDFVFYQPRSLSEIKARLDRYLSKENLEAEERKTLKGLIIEELEKLDLIDDTKAAKIYVENIINSSKPRSKRALYNFLLKKGLSKESIEEAMRKFTDDVEEANIRFEVKGKIGQNPENIGILEKQKYASYLIRKGYNSSIVFDVLNRT